jgi:hypothetical protein
MHLAHTHITRALGLAAVALAIGGTATANAQPPTTETITSTWTAGPDPTPPLYRGFGSGTFTATGPVNDTGAINILGHDVAIPSPIVGILHVDETLAGKAGTLELRCTEPATDFSDLTAVPSTGPCAITGGTGAYAQLQGHGTVNSVANLITRTATDTIVFNVA